MTGISVLAGKVAGDQPNRPEVEDGAPLCLGWVNAELLVSRPRSQDMALKLPNASAGKPFGSPLCQLLL